MTHVCFTVPEIISLEIISLVKISLVFKFYLLMKVFPAGVGEDANGLPRRPEAENTRGKYRKCSKGISQAIYLKKKGIPSADGNTIRLPESGWTPGTVFLGAYST